MRVDNYLNPTVKKNRRILAIVFLFPLNGPCAVWFEKLREDVTNTKGSILLFLLSTHFFGYLQGIRMDQSMDSWSKEVYLDRVYSGEGSGKAGTSHCLRYQVRVYNGFVVEASIGWARRSKSETITVREGTKQSRTGAGRHGHGSRDQVGSRQGKIEV